MASTTSITVNCPDCGAPQQLAVHLTNTVSGNQNELRLHLDRNQFNETFSQHALAEPANHPTLAKPEQWRVIGDDNVAAAERGAYIPGPGGEQYV
jgi:hypothetical protein